ncbi:MAG: cupredoxin domain-containing protein [Vitreoscilla sp.]|nr:cupredoxin domain-containing protein [Vitreoscilla sp.]
MNDLSHTRRTLALAGLCTVTLLGTPAAWAVETASFEIVARAGKLVPERLEVPAGVRLKLTLRNEGKAPVEFESKELRIEKVLGPNATAVVTVQSLKPGSYKLVDEFHEATSQMQLIAK